MAVSTGGDPKQEIAGAVCGALTAAALASLGNLFNVGFALFPLYALLFVVLAWTFGPLSVLTATAIGAVAMSLVLPGEGLAVSDPIDALSLFATVAVGCGIAILGARRQRFVAMKTFELERESAAADTARLMQRELTHRIANDFAILDAITRLAGRDSVHSETGEALDALSARIRLLAGIYRRLQPEGRGADVDAEEFLVGLCRDLQETRLGLRPLNLEYAIEPIEIPFGAAVIVGLMTIELLTNATKHAFPDDRPGKLRVELGPVEENQLQLTVADNGVGFDGAAVPPGRLGMRLINALALRLGGQFGRSRAGNWTIARVVFPRPQPKLPISA